MASRVHDKGRTAYANSYMPLLAQAFEPQKSYQSGVLTAQLWRDSESNHQTLSTTLQNIDPRLQGLGER